MCGICGFNYTDKKVIKVMNDEISHRGPDGEGFYIDKNVSLGHRRLSIIDINGGKNPIYNEDKNICIMFNGEIYNYREIKPELERLGHVFSTNADTDVIIHGYEEYGVDCLHKFNGMFAFCLYDKKNNVMFLARDRFGVKPLYYYYKDSKFIFASEIKALLKNPIVQTEPNDKVIANYLTNNEIPEDKEETFFTNIKKLLPGHYALVKNGKLTIKQYYSIKNINNKVFEKIDEKEAIKKYYDLFADSVRLRLISDVPVGACLSGGMDSSAIVGMIAQLLKQKIKEGESVHGKLNCFSAVYNDKTIDERSYIKEAIKNKKAVSHYTFPLADGFWKYLKTTIYHQDEPTETIAIYAQYAVMKLAKSKVKVLLDGQGSDESVAGYIPYYRHYLLDLLKGFHFIQLAKESFFGFNFIKDLFHTFIRVRKAQKQSPGFYTDNSVKQVNYVTDSFKTLLERQYSDFTKNLPKVLKYEDRNSMAFGIEARLPFLDYRLVEYSFSLPESMKIRNGWTKFVLRQAMKKILSKKITERKSKFGFPVPDYDWLITNQKQIKTLFNSSLFKSRKYFNHDAVRSSFDLFVTDKKQSYLSSDFWRIINLEIWLRIFFPTK